MGGWGGGGGGDPGHFRFAVWGLGTFLTLGFLVAVGNTLNTKTHSSNEIAEFSFENADVKSF